MHTCLVIRHGIAEDAAQSGRDRDRALTAEGREAMRAAAVGLVTVAQRPTTILASPYIRARETAQLVAEAWNDVPVTERDAIASGATPADLLAVVADHCRGDSQRLVLVGHEPDLGRFITHALAGDARTFHTPRKGSASLLQFPARPKSGNAMLEWSMESSHLQTLSRASSLPHSR